MYVLCPRTTRTCIGTETGGWAVDMQWVQVRKEDEKGRCQISASCPCPTLGLFQAGVGVRGPITERLLSSAHWRFLSISSQCLTTLTDSALLLDKEAAGCCSVAKSCPALCDPRDCSTTGLPVLHYPPEFAQTRVHWAGDAIQPSHPLPPPSLPAVTLSQHQGLFQRVGSSLQVAKVLELVLASVLPVNVQGWFPLGLTALISLQFKGLSRVFSSTTIQRHSFFSIQPS